MDANTSAKPCGFVAYRCHFACVCDGDTAPMNSTCRFFWFAACMGSAAVGLGACISGPAPQRASQIEAPNLTAATAALVQDAAAIAPQMQEPLAQEFLRAASSLRAPPQPMPRVVYSRAKDRLTITAAQHAALPVAERAEFVAQAYDAAFYFATHYGSPVAYARALEVAGRYGPKTLRGLAVLDIGYGAIGGPRLLAGAGARVQALDADSLLPALYNQAADQGRVVGFEGRTGYLTLRHGVFAADQGLTAQIGGGYGLVVAKNTLKRGFMKPQPGRKAVVSFDVADAVLLRALHASLAPGGLLVIYNLSGALDPSRPATDGRSPFAIEDFERAGFTVLAFDAHDDASAPAMGQALGWAKGMGDLNANLFARFTVVQRPAR
jgi:hypothetical protein